MKRCESKNQRYGTRISVSPLTFVSAAALVFLGHGVALLSYIAVLVPHELAHACVGEKLGYAARTLRIMPYGIALGGEYEYVKPSHEIAVAAAGPAVNFAMFLFLAALWWIFPVTYAATKGIADASLFTAAINMLPVLPMDGGRILRGLLRRKFPERKQRVMSQTVGVIAGIAAIAGAFALMLTGVNFTFATLGLFIAASLLLPGRDVGYGRLYAMTNMRVRLRGGLPVRELMVSSDSTAVHLFGMLRPDVYTRFVICDEFGKPVVVLDEGRLEEAITQLNCPEYAISVAKNARI